MRTVNIASVSQYMAGTTQRPHGAVFGPALACINVNAINPDDWRPIRIAPRKRTRVIRDPNGEPVEIFARNTLQHGDPHCARYHFQFLISRNPALRQRMSRLMSARPESIPRKLAVPGMAADLP